MPGRPLSDRARPDVTMAAAVEALPTHY